MKLIQQVKLFFREGNSDKVYEIDLCEMGSDKFLVNFRYGRRGAALKEGTKTAEAVSRDKAMQLFSALEAEKRAKGYQTEAETFIELPSLEGVNTQTVKGAILRRLQDAVDGKNSFKTGWKTSRVIWKAGALQMQEAIPFILKLATKGDELQTYAAIYMLIKMRELQAQQLFQSFAFSTGKNLFVRNIAYEGLLSLTTTENATELCNKLIALLPEELQPTIQQEDIVTYETVLNQLVQQKEVHFLTDLYLLCKVKTTLLPALHSVLKTVRFAPPFFKYIRAIYKLAQLRQDAFTVAILSYRLEKEKAFFKVSSSDGKRGRERKELKTKESKLAFSQYTKEYFQKNSLAYLCAENNFSDAKAYVRLAVATLLQYKETDFEAATEQPRTPYGVYDYKTKKYTYTLISYPECASALLLSVILFGNDTKRELLPSLKFATGKRNVESTRYYYSPETSVPVATPATLQHGSNETAQGDNGDSGSVIDTAVSFFKNIFGKKAPASAPQQAPIPVQPAIVQPEIKKTMPPRTELYAAYWDSIPEAYVQLLMQAQLKTIHNFAYNNLKAHKDFEAICAKFDEQTILQLLNTHFLLPQEFGYELLTRKADVLQNSILFVAQVLNANYADARFWAKDVITMNATTFMNDLSFVLTLLFNRHADCKTFINDLLRQTVFAQERLQAITGKVITDLLHLPNTEENNVLALAVIDKLKLVAQAPLQQISWSIVGQLMSSDLNANKLLAGDILLFKTKDAATDVPFSIVYLFAGNPVADIRKNGISLLNNYPTEFLQTPEHLQSLLDMADSEYEDVLHAVVNRLRLLLVTTADTRNTIVRNIVYALIRKEKYEGAHAVLLQFGSNDLKPYWNTGLQPKDITKLVHAQYRPSQLLGLEILEGYDRPDAFTLPQIISFGNHELLALRQWSRSYFQQHVERIRAEKNKALGILDATWDDTRAFAFHFFKTSFEETDWDTDTLIGITDSIRPDVEAFGKELITRYFKPEHALEYLEKLSQHPSLNVQALVTGYLSVYAADNLPVLQSLEFYFRSVLMRVNKGRVAKDRVFAFVQTEALKNEATAKWATALLDDVAAQTTVQDKATCIDILTAIKHRYPQTAMHLTIKN
ncbi:MAG: WGR domain-containing protein [Filimonas sp.]|nr:WGR domain-containing protein [Filimonas sp.]